MRNMSFFLTTEQYRNRTKTHTMRLGWANLKPGEKFMGVVKGQGIPKGGKVERLHAAECLSNRPERLDAITKEVVVKEGFPELCPGEFIRFFCLHNKCGPDQIVNWIEFKHL